jgi:hypothetical protein
MSNKRPAHVEQEIDETVTAQSDDDIKWEPSIKVKKAAFAYKTLEEWAGAQYLNLTLLFTDIVDSTRLGVELGDHKWIENLFVHFSRARKLASEFDCYIVKIIGDAIMVAFRAAPEAIRFAIELSTDTGVDYIGIRVGVNSGHVQIRENDIYGLNVNFTSRIQHMSKREGILVSDSDKIDFEKAFGKRLSDIRFGRKEEDIKSFGLRTFWEIRTRSWVKAVGKQRAARSVLLGDSPPGIGIGNYPRSS